jgi:hypothetical protein
MSCAMLARERAAAAVPKAKAASSSLWLDERDDSFELEADRAADGVVASGNTKPEWSLSRMIGGAPLQRKSSSCDSGNAGKSKECNEKETLQRPAAGLAVPSTTPSTVHEVLCSPGQPLDTATRAFFEPRFGHDFGNVRVHTDRRAQISAAAVNAQAYTVGTSIVFGDGMQRSTRKGNRLLGHELAHVVQQSVAVRAPANLTILNDAEAERQAEQAAEQVDAGDPVGQLNATAGPTIQREEESPKPAVAELNWFEKGLIEAAAAPALAMGETVHAMVKATLRGFLVEIKTQAPSRGAELWNHVKEAFAHPTEIGAFLLRYWWGLIKGVFSPITGLFDMAKMVDKLTLLGAQVLSSAWKRREELAADAANLGNNLAALGASARDAIATFRENPLQTVKALRPWFSSLEQDAVSAAESGGHKAGAVLIEQVGKPLPELGETAGEIIGTLLVNIVLLVFTDGIGNAITQISSKLGELCAFLSKFSKAAEMLGKIVAEVGELLGTAGAWISKAEAALAKVAETVLKPIAPLMAELGKLMGGLRSFLRKLLGVSEEAADAATEQFAGAAARDLGGPAAPQSPLSGPEPVVAPKVEKPVVAPKVEEPIVATKAEKPVVAEAAPSGKAGETGTQQDLGDLRQSARTDQDAAHALANRYKQMSDFELFRRFADEGDETAAAIIRQRFPSNEAALRKVLGSNYRPPHSATAILRRNGVEVSRQPLRSGNMTAEERALGFPKNTLATHTETRAVKQAGLRPGDNFEIQGQYDPCGSCMRAMQDAATNSGATITYWWPGGSEIFHP